jgi:hypothetical protein
VSYESPQQTRRLNVDADDLAGALAARRELGLESELAVINAFLEHTGQAIDTRVDQRIALHGAVSGQRLPSDADRHRSAAIKLAIVSMILSIPITAITVSFGPLAGPILALFVWTAIAVINVSFQRSRP